MSNENKMNKMINLFNHHGRKGIIHLVPRYWLLVTRYCLLFTGYWLLITGYSLLAAGPEISLPASCEEIKLEMGSGNSLVIPEAVRLKIQSEGFWNLYLQAEDDLVNRKDPNKKIPVSRLSLSPHNGKNWIPMNKEPRLLISGQPGGSAEIIYDYRLSRRRRDPPGKYRVKLTYVVEESSSAPTLAGIVKDRQTHEAIAGMKVEVKPITGHRSPVTGTTHTDGQGVYRFQEAIAPGKYVLSYLWNDEPQLYKPKKKSIELDDSPKQVDALIDPMGLVYDSITKKPIPGAKIALRNPDGTLVLTPQPNPQLTDSSGKYHFDVEPGNYFLTADAADYQFYCSDIFSVAVPELSRNIELIPLNLQVGPYLSIEKSANRLSGSIGEIITYSIILKNISTEPLKDLKIEDTMPYNFTYIKGTSRLNDKPISDPGGNNPYVWEIDDLEAEEVAILRYSTIIGVEAKLGPNQNQARVFGPGEGVMAGPCFSVVFVQPGIFSRQAIIIGKVFEDKNGDGIQNRGEEGLGGIAITMEDGTRVTTDLYGRYSIANVNPGVHILKLEQVDLEPNSIFVHLPKGGMAKGNFAIYKTSAEAKAPDFFLVALGDESMGSLDVKGSAKYLEGGDSDGYKKGFYQAGRLAYALKFTRGPYQITSALDTHRDYYWRRLYRSVDPNRFYPLYGDESSVSRPYDTQGKFYLNLQRGSSGLLFGNFSTGEFAETYFNKYARTLHGIKGEFKTGKEIFSLTGFGASSQQQRAIDEIAALGISGFYWLSRMPVVEFTERVRIEIRDKDHPEIVLTPRSMEREKDYDIDYEQGRIMFHDPIPSTDMSDNPVYIVVEYEYLPLKEGLELSKKTVLGLRSNLSPLKFVDFGATYLQEESDELGIGQFYILNSQTNLPGKTDISLEYATGEGEKKPSLFPWKEETSAWKLDLKSSPFKQLNLKGWYKRSGLNFLDLTRYLTHFRGEQTEKYGGSGEMSFTPQTKLSLNYLHSRSLLTNDRQNSTSVNLNHREDKLSFLSNYEIRESITPSAVLPSIKDYIVSNRIDWDLTKKLNLGVEHKLDWAQDTRKKEPVFLRGESVGGFADYKLTPQTSLSLKHEYFEGVDLLTDTLFYANTTKLRIEKPGLKKEITQAAGFIEKIGANLNFERKDISGVRPSLQQAAAAGLKLPITQKLHVDARYEMNERKDVVVHRTGKLGEIGFEGKIMNDLSVLSSYRYGTTRDEIINRLIGIDQNLTTALAYRPVNFDWINILAKYQRIHFKNLLYIRRVTNNITEIGSVEGWFDLTRHLGISAKYAHKKMEEGVGGASSQAATQIINARIVYRLPANLDLSAEARILQEKGSEQLKKEFALEWGYTALGIIRIAGGYRFLSYEDKPALGNNYRAQGPYVRFSGKYRGLSEIRQERAKKAERAKAERLARLKQYYTRAAEFYKNEEFDQCISRCEKILKLDSTHRATLELLERVKRDQKIKRLKDLYITAVTLYKEGKYPEAIREWEKVLKLDPIHQLSQQMIEKAKGKINEKEQAEKIRQMKTHWAQGTKYYKTGQYKKAIEEFEAILKLDPTHQQSRRMIEKSKEKLKE